MSGRYMIEVKQEFITPITVDANTQREAVEKVLGQQGNAGDTFPGETLIASVRRLDG
ncbi:MAG: hypothetical protein V7708_17455 [Oceanicoccus sp.]